MSTQGRRITRMLLPKLVSFVLVQHFLLLKSEPLPTTAPLYTGLDFAQAFNRMQFDGGTLFLMNNIRVEDTDWAGYSLPINITSNVTITARPELQTLPVLTFTIKSPKIRLAGGVALFVRRIVINQNRRGVGTLSPGGNLFAPTLSDRSRPGLLLVEGCLLVHPVCMPRDVEVGSIARLPRPAAFPGTQRPGTLVSQAPNCTNSSAAPVQQRCWPRWGLYEDIAMPGLDPDESGIIRDMHYDMWIRNSQFICQVAVTKECVQTLGETGCFLYNFDTKVTPLFEATASPSPQRPFIDNPDSQQTKDASGSGSDPPLLAVVLPCVLGGCFLLAVLGYSIVVLHRRKQNREGLYGGKGVSNDGFPPDCNTSAITPETAGCTAPASVKGGCDKHSSESRSLGSTDAVREAAPVVVASPQELRGSASLEQPASTTGGGIVPEAPVIVTPFTPHRSDLRLDVQYGTEVKLLPVVRGQGNFGRVVEGLYDGCRVAVKLVPDLSAWSGAPRNALQTYVQEVEVLGRCQHPNVVRLLAACLTPPRMCLVMELMEISLDRLLYNVDGHGRALGPDEPVLPQGQGPAAREGDGLVEQQQADPGQPSQPPLEGAVHLPRQQQQGAHPWQPQEPPLHQPHLRGLLPMEKVLHIGIEVARALEYLHPTIVHRDLKPGNVLLNDPCGPKPVVKLTDFGLSRLRSTAQITKHPEAGTPSYMAPELYDISNAVITDKSDMYSLGVLLWEMCSGQLPWEGCDALVVAYAITINRNRLPLTAIPNDRRPPKLAKLIQRLWDHDPLRRPAAAEVVKQLTLLQLELERGQRSQAMGPGQVQVLMAVPAEGGTVQAQGQAPVQQAVQLQGQAPVQAQEQVQGQVPAGAELARMQSPRVDSGAGPSMLGQE